jgi:hypothetical protein
MEAVLGILFVGALALGLLGVFFGAFSEGDIEAKRCNPDLNTRDWALHQQRLSVFGRSQYKGCYYYVGPRGGVYYINSNGRKTYC